MTTLKCAHHSLQVALKACPRPSLILSGVIDAIAVRIVVLFIVERAFQNPEARSTGLRQDHPRNAMEAPIGHHIDPLMGRTEHPLPVSTHQGLPIDRKIT
jgi:hypothetical protein